jgi:MFS family permease
MKSSNYSGQICIWDYDGTGEEYQILAGPVFIVIYTFSGVILGLFSGTFNRKNILIFCLFLWSAMTLLTGFSKHYWHLLLTRFILGIG